MAGTQKLLHLPNAWEQSAFDFGHSEQWKCGKTFILVLAVTLYHCVSLDMPRPSLGLSFLMKLYKLGYTGGGTMPWCEY